MRLRAQLILSVKNYRASIPVMGNSFANIKVHLIFHTKSRGCQMREEDLSRIFHYIGGVIRSMSGCAYMVGGRPDHIHVLTTLPSQISLADFVRDVKSNTTKWIKTIDSYYKDFAWQEGYGAFSVSESNQEAVVHYIEHQKEHHHTHTTQVEFCAFLAKHGFKIEDINWWCKSASKEKL